MADREKDFSQNGTLSPNYPNGTSDDSDHTGTLNPNYPNHNSSGYHLHDGMDSDQALRKIRTAGSISISPELFEKIYLSPQNNVKGDLRRTFANPTPLALLGFLLSLSPLSCDLMGWRGAGGSGSAGIGAYMFFGGLLMILGGVMEFILGNTFPFVVFCSFGAFWLTFGYTITPIWEVYAAYSPDPATPAAGATAPGFYASFAFFQVFMGVLCLIYLVCALRTNIAFLVIFFTLVLAFGFLSGAYWQLAQGNAVLGGKLVVVAGACTFVTSMAGWWIFFAQMLAAVDFPIQLPVGDISHIIKGASVRQKEKDEYSA